MWRIREAQIKYLQMQVELLDISRIDLGETDRRRNIEDIY